VDRQGEFDGNNCTEEEVAVILEDAGNQDDNAKANPAAYAIFQRYMHDACMNIELAVESDALDGQEWQRLNRQFSYIANIASLFGKAELG